MKNPLNYYFKAIDGGMYMLEPYRAIHMARVDTVLFIFFDNEELAFKQTDLSPFGHSKGLLIPVTPESSREAEQVNTGLTLKPLTEPEFFFSYRSPSERNLWVRVKVHKYTPSRLIIEYEGKEYAFNRHTMAAYGHKEASLWPMDAACKRDTAQHNERVKRDEFVDLIKWVMRNKQADVPTAILEQAADLLKPYHQW